MTRQRVTHVIGRCQERFDRRHAWPVATQSALWCNRGVALSTIKGHHAARHAWLHMHTLTVQHRHDRNTLGLHNEDPNVNVLWYRRHRQFCTSASSAAQFRLILRHKFPVICHAYVFFQGCPCPLIDVINVLHHGAPSPSFSSIILRMHYLQDWTYYVQTMSSRGYILVTVPVYDPTELSRDNRVATVQRSLSRLRHVHSDDTMQT